MPNKNFQSAEYEALSRVITADKRLRRFQYALTVVLFLLVVAGGYNIQRNIARKIDGLVDGSIARGNARQQEAKTISRETTRYITCLFILPIDQRTPDNQQKCFKAADLPGGLTRSDFSPIILNPDGSVVLVSEAGGQSGVSDGLSSSSPEASRSSSDISPSPQSAPQTPPGQSTNLQPSGNNTPTPQPSLIQRLFTNVKGLL